jgi:hypothetical protein
VLSAVGYHDCEITTFATGRCFSEAEVIPLLPLSFRLHNKKVRLCPEKCLLFDFGANSSADFISHLNESCLEAVSNRDRSRKCARLTSTVLPMRFIPGLARTIFLFATFTLNIVALL